jgi:hypothetical protein
MSVVRLNLYLGPTFDLEYSHFTADIYVVPRKFVAEEPRIKSL